MEKGESSQGCRVVAAMVMTVASDGEERVEGIQQEGMCVCVCVRARARARERERERERERRAHHKLESWEKAKEGVVLGARASRRAQAPGLPVPSHLVAR